MSWAAYLTDDRGHSEGEWGYTHNTNGMIEACLDPNEVDSTAERPPFWVKLGNTTMGRGAWWDLLDGKAGATGAELLDHVIRGLEADPERFRAMNPDNGWGNYDRLLEELRSMRDAVPEWPTTWTTHG